MVEFEETWKAIAGYEGYYEVSDHGRVRSLPRLVEAAWKPIKLKGRLLKFAHDNRGGYAFVVLSKEGIRTLRRVHRLVLETFVGPCPEWFEVACHNDNNPLNNRLDNLRWDTQYGNLQDSIDYIREAIRKRGRTRWPAIGTSTLD